MELQPHVQLLPGGYAVHSSAVVMMAAKELAGSPVESDDMVCDESQFFHLVFV